MKLRLDTGASPSTPHGSASRGTPASKRGGMSRCDAKIRSPRPTRHRGGTRARGGRDTPDTARMPLWFSDEDEPRENFEPLKLVTFFPIFCSRVFREFTGTRPRALMPQVQRTYRRQPTGHRVVILLDILMSLRRLYSFKRSYAWVHRSPDRSPCRRSRRGGPGRGKPVTSVDTTRGRLVPVAPQVRVHAARRRRRNSRDHQPRHRERRF